MIINPSRNGHGTIFSAFFGTSLSSAFVTALTFISGVLITRALGPVGRAEYGAVLLIAATYAGLGCLSFFDASIVQLQRTGEEKNDRLPTMVASALAITALSTVAIMVLLPWLDLGLTEVSMHFFIAFTFLIIATQMMIQCFSAFERSQMKFGMVNVERVGAPAVFSLLIVAVWLVGGNTLTATLALTLFIASKLPVILVWLRLYRRYLIGKLSWPFAKNTLIIGLKFHVAVALGLLAAQLDRLIALAAWPKEILGQYFVAFSAVGVGYSVVTTAMNTVLMPYLTAIPAEERAFRIGQIIRLTLLVIVFIVLAGWLIIPFAMPLLYGEDFAPATEIAMGLLFAMSFQPLRAIVLESGRSLGKGQPSTEMALTSIVTMFAGYLLTDFAVPGVLVATLGASTVFSTLVGARHMVRDGDILLSSTFVPTAEDLRLIKSIFNRVRG